jgi:hypothetical protein
MKDIKKSNIKKKSSLLLGNIVGFSDNKNLQVVSEDKEVLKNEEPK